MAQMVPILHFQHEHVQCVRRDEEDDPSARHDVVPHGLNDEEQHVQRGGQRDKEDCALNDAPNDVEDVQHVLRDGLMDNAILRN